MHRYLFGVLGCVGLVACSGGAPDGPSRSNSSALRISSGGFTAGISAPSSAVYVGGDEANVVFGGASGTITLGTATPGSAWSWTDIAGPGTLASDPTMVVRLNTGEKDIVARGAGNTLLYFWNTGTGWYSTAIPGPGAFSEPSLFVRDDGEADIVVQGPNGTLDYYYARPSANWSMTEIAHAGSTFSAPSIFVRPGGEADVVAQGPNNTLMYYYAWPGTSWSSTQVAFPGTTFGRPAVFVRDNNEADIVVRGTGNSLMYYWAYPSTAWSSTEITATDAASDPSIFVCNADEADIVVNAPDGSMRLFLAYPGWGWQESAIGRPVSWPSRPSIFVRGEWPDMEYDVVQAFWTPLPYDQGFDRDGDYWHAPWKTRVFVDATINWMVGFP